MDNIFDQIITPVMPTLAERKQEVADHVVQSTLAFAQGLVQELNKLFLATWGQQNTWGLTATQVIDGMGTRGASLFQTHGAMVQSLPTICPSVTYRVYEQGVQPGPLEVLIPSPDWVIDYEIGGDGQPTGRVLISEAA